MPKPTTFRPFQEAAEAGQTIRAAEQSGDHAVLDSDDYLEALEAARAAISLLRRPVLGIEYQTVVLEATYDAHGAHLAPGQAIASPDGTHTSVIVAIRAAHPVDDRTRTPLIGSVAADLRRMEADLDVYVAERVFVVLQPDATVVDALG